MTTNAHNSPNLTFNECNITFPRAKNKNQKPTADTTLQLTASECGDVPKQHTAPGKGFSSTELHMITND